MDKQTIKILTKHCFDTLTTSPSLQEEGWLHRMDLEEMLRLSQPLDIDAALMQALWESLAQDDHFEIRYDKMIRATFGHDNMVYPICEQPPEWLYFVYGKRSVQGAYHQGIDELLRLYSDPIKALDDTSLRKYVLCVVPTEDLRVLTFAGNYFVEYLPANVFTYHAKEDLMPLYDYVCPKCEHTFEKLKSFDQRKDPEPCPVCQHEECEKQLASFSIQYKGEGFYTTDYRKKNFE